MDDRTLLEIIKAGSNMSRDDIVPVSVALGVLRGKGYVVVPREPTEAMVLAGVHHENMGDMAGRWRAMVDGGSSGNQNRQEHPCRPIRCLR